ILLGNGSGGFTPGPGSPFASLGVLAVGDFNGDGKTDLAVSGPTGLTVLLGNGSGGFAPAAASPVIVSGGAAVGDFNGDGKLDLAVASTNFNTLASTITV